MLAILELNKVICVSRISSRPKPQGRPHLTAGTPERAPQTPLPSLVPDTGHLGWPGDREDTRRDVRKVGRFGFRNLSRMTGRRWMLRNLHPSSHDLARRVVVSCTLQSRPRNSKEGSSAGSPIAAAYRTPRRSPSPTGPGDNIFIFTSFGTRPFNTSWLKYEAFLFLHRSLNFPSVYWGRLSKNAPRTKQHRLYKTSNHRPPCVYGPRIHVSQLLGKTSFFPWHNSGNYSMPQNADDAPPPAWRHLPSRHTFSVITAYMKINLS